MASDYLSSIIYKTLSDPVFYKMFLLMRSRTGAVLVPKKQTLRKLAMLRHQTFITIFASDQTPGRNEAVYWTRFLNQEAPVFLGIEKISNANNSVVIFCDIKRIGRGRYTVTYVTLFKEPRETSEYNITKGHIKIGRA